MSANLHLDAKYYHELQQLRGEHETLEAAKLESDGRLDATEVRIAELEQENTELGASLNLVREFAALMEKSRNGDPVKPGWVARELRQCFDAGNSRPASTGGAS